MFKYIKLDRDKNRYVWVGVHFIVSTVSNTILSFLLKSSFIHHQSVK